MTIYINNYIFNEIDYIKQIKNIQIEKKKIDNYILIVKVPCYYIFDFFDFYLFL